MVEKATLRFSRAAQNLGPLQEAAYRLIGVASCKIDADESEFICTLTCGETNPPSQSTLDVIEARFLDLVTDENIRSKIFIETAPTRNLLMALAFGAWASPAQSER